MKNLEGLLARIEAEAPNDELRRLLWTVFMAGRKQLDEIDQILAGAYPERVADYVDSVAPGFDPLRSLDSANLMIDRAEDKLHGFQVINISSGNLGAGIVASILIMRDLDEIVDIQAGSPDLVFEAQARIVAFIRGLLKVAEMFGKGRS
jgi:hypothetical protein